MTSSKPSVLGDFSPVLRAIIRILEGTGYEVRHKDGQTVDNPQRIEELVLHHTQTLLEGLVASLDYRDAETQRHSRRVALFARRLAQELGIEGPGLTVIEQGAMLHDIGKIGVRDAVLLKPGPLTPDEWVEMKKHSEIGWQLLNRVEYLKPIALIVLQHQEMWDGSGYPQGLTGEDIVIGARVFHVVDALDAMTSERPYRRARLFSEACTEIEKCSGSQFDPRVVEAFLKVPFEDWERIRIAVRMVELLSEGLTGLPLAQYLNS